MTVAESTVTPEPALLRVSAQSRPSAVAGAIAAVVRERRRAEVQAVGAGAVNQAVKAIAIARGYLTPSGLEIICIPYFVDVVIGDEERTAIRLSVEPRCRSDADLRRGGPAQVGAEQGADT